VEVVKQDTFREVKEHYGRTSYFVTEDAPEVTVVFHLLARYAVASGDGSPSSILEELVPVGVPVYREGTLSEEQVQQLIDADPSPQTRTDEEVRRTIDDLFEEHEDNSDHLREAVDERRTEVVEERRSIQEELAEEETQATAWTEGIADIAEGSYDVLAMTVYYPA
jgi:polyhydroxyalkanoate synthesis regulator phasin